MTLRVTYSPECDICGRQLQSQDFRYIHGSPVPTPARSSHHFNFDVCGSCEEELLKAKEVLVGVMTMKREQETAQPEPVRYTRDQWRAFEHEELMQMLTQGAAQGMQGVQVGQTPSAYPSFSTGNLAQRHTSTAATLQQLQQLLSTRTPVPLK